MKQQAALWRGARIAVALAAFLALLAALCIATPQQAHAKTYTSNGITTLYTPNVYSSSSAAKTATYKKADVTGDKKKDKVQLVMKLKKAGSKYAPASCQLKINGKVVKKCTMSGSGWAFSSCDIISLKNKKTFISITEYKGNNARAVIYQVKKNKLKKVVSLNSYFDPKTIAGVDASPVKVKGNTIYWYASINTKALGYISTDEPLKLTYSKGKFKMSSSSATVYTYSFTAKSAISAKKSISSSKATASIKKGGSFKVTKMAFKGKTVYVKVKASDGKSGWIKLGKSQIAKTKAP